MISICCIRFAEDSLAKLDVKITLLSTYVEKRCFPQLFLRIRLRWVGGYVENRGYVFEREQLEQIRVEF